MTNAQRQAADLIVLHPDWTDAKVAEACHKSRAWICRLRQHEDFKEYLKDRLNQAWANAGVHAREVMINLLDDPRSDISFKASQFILQSLYPEMTPTSRVQADVNSNIISVSIEDSDD